MQGGWGGVGGDFGVAVLSDGMDAMPSCDDWLGQLWELYDEYLDWVCQRRSR